MISIFHTLDREANSKYLRQYTGLLLKEFYSDTELKDFEINGANYNGYVHLEKYLSVWERVNFNKVKKYVTSEL